MKTKKITLIYVLFLLISGNLLSQNSWEFEGVYSANLSTLVPKEGLNNFKEALYHSFGVRGNFILKSKFYFTSGVFLYNQGTTTQISVTTVDRPEGTGEFVTANWMAKTLAIPLKAGYYFIDNQSIIFGTELGFLNGFLLKQEVEVNSEKQEIHLYNDFIMSVDFAIDFGIKINEKLKVKVRPSLNYQLQENISGFKLFSYGLDFGICYKLK